MSCFGSLFLVPVFDFILLLLFSSFERWPQSKICGYFFRRQERRKQL